MPTSLLARCCTSPIWTGANGFAPSGRLKTILGCFWTSLVLFCVNTASLASRLNGGEGRGVAKKKVSTSESWKQTAGNLFDSAATFREGVREDTD